MTHNIHRKVGTIALRETSQAAIKHRKREIYNQHGIGNLMFANTTTKNDHSCLAGGTRVFVQVTNISDNIEEETGGAKRMEINHVANRSVSKSGTIDRNVILGEGNLRRMVIK